jgi:soluble lytic murein transglycosylase
VKISLILAVITVESAFKPLAVSKAGASGLMQLMPETAEECARDVGKVNYSAFRVKDNIQLGTWYLHKLSNIFKGEMEMVVRAYNAGPVLVKRVSFGESDHYPEETIKYLEKVLKWKEKYEKFDL